MVEAALFGDTAVALGQPSSLCFTPFPLPQTGSCTNWRALFDDTAVALGSLPHSVLRRFPSLKLTHIQIVVKATQFQ
ncbi:MAG: hypothetical protein H6667_21195 [Ardenticatenaceae bacterium]|nr:hypothetical protein [Ardenticatenaceae bacterium]MCB9445063.1 hypothetical protein [Ardenticatenaceae bacterium]